MNKNSILILILIIVISLASAVFAYQPIWEKVSDFRPWNLGLDLAGGSYLVYEIDLSEVESSDRSSVT
ncbi:MAG: hypothetical protein WD607_00105, partial [Candidatus Paceibacterota bacterium]